MEIIKCTDKEETTMKKAIKEAYITGYEDGYDDGCMDMVDDGSDLAGKLPETDCAWR